MDRVELVMELLGLEPPSAETADQLHKLLASKLTAMTLKSVSRSLVFSRSTGCFAFLLRLWSNEVSCPHRDFSMLLSLPVSSHHYVCWCCGSVPH